MSSGLCSAPTASRRSRGRGSGCGSRWSAFRPRARGRSDGPISTVSPKSGWSPHLLPRPRAWRTLYADTLGPSVQRLSKTSRIGLGSRPLSFSRWWSDYPFAASATPRAATSWICPVLRFLSRTRRRRLPPDLGCHAPGARQADADPPRVLPAADLRYEDPALHTDVPGRWRRRREMALRAGASPARAVCTPSAHHAARARGRSEEAGGIPRGLTRFPPAPAASALSWPQNMSGLDQHCSALHRCDRRVRPVHLRQRLPALSRRANGRQDGASPRRRNPGSVDDLGALLPDRAPGRVWLLSLARDAAALAMAGASARCRPALAHHGAPDPHHPGLEPAHLREPGAVPRAPAHGHGGPALLRRFGDLAADPALVLAHRPSACQ